MVETSYISPDDYSEVFEGNPVKTGNCPATVKGTKDNSEPLSKEPV